jgi:hypothetical protein
VKSSSNRVILISGRLGGPDTGPVHKLMVELGAVFLRHCNHKFSDSVTNVSLFFEVGGILTDYESFGVTKVALTGSMLDIELCMPAKYHQGKPSQEVRLRVFDLVSDCVRDAIRFVQKMQFDFDVDKFCERCSVALADFLAAESPLGDELPTPIEKAFLKLLELRRLANALGETGVEIAVNDDWIVQQNPVDPAKIVFRRLSDGYSI